MNSLAANRRKSPVHENPVSREKRKPRLWSEATEASGSQQTVEPTNKAVARYEGGA